MTYRGHVKNGMVILDEPADLIEGACVTIEVVPSGTKREDTGPPSLAERLEAIIGKARSLPDDAAENHDHYLYGLPKQ